MAAWLPRIHLWALQKWTTYRMVSRQQTNNLIPWLWISTTIYQYRILLLLRTNNRIKWRCRKQFIKVQIWIIIKWVTLRWTVQTRGSRWSRPDFKSVLRMQAVKWTESTTKSNREWNQVKRRFCRKSWSRRNQVILGRYLKRRYTVQKTTKWDSD